MLCTVHCTAQPRPSCTSVCFHSADSLARVTADSLACSPHSEPLLPLPSNGQPFMHHMAILIYTHFISSVLNPNMSKSERLRKVLAEARFKHIPPPGSLRTRQHQGNRENFESTRSIPSEVMMTYLITTGANT